MVSLPQLFVLSLLHCIHIVDASVDGASSTAIKTLVSQDYISTTETSLPFIIGSDLMMDSTLSNSSAVIPLQKRWNVGRGGETFSMTCQQCWTFCAPDCDRACCNLGKSYPFPAGGSAAGENQGIGGYSGGRYGGYGGYGHRYCSGASSIIKGPSVWIESHSLLFSKGHFWPGALDGWYRVSLQLLTIALVAGHIV